MRKLEAVEEAKTLMTEAMEWSTFKWLWEKQRVRETADRANAALDRRERAVKAKWSDEQKALYKEMVAAKSKKHEAEVQEQAAPETIGARVLLQKVMEADRSAARARADAEDTFDQAEKQLNVSLAREGCKKAIHSWELHEKAIRKAEAVMETSLEDRHLDGHQTAP